MNDLLKFQDFALRWLVKNGPGIAYAALILVVGYWLGKKLSALVNRALSGRKIDQILVDFFSDFVFYALMVAVAFAAANQVGINTTSFLAVAGSALLAIGLAVKDNVSNFSSGILLVFLRPFTVGDFIMAGGAAGTVQRISLSNTILNTPDNMKVFIPNSKLMGDVIINATANAKRRVDLVFGVGYDDDLDKAKRLIFDILASDPRILKDPAPVAAVSELADSSVNIVVRPWVSSREYWEVRFDLTEAIKRAFDKNGITIPFPQREVRIVSETEAA